MMTNKKEHCQDLPPPHRWNFLDLHMLIFFSNHVVASFTLTLGLDPLKYGNLVLNQGSQIQSSAHLTSRMRLF